MKISIITVNLNNAAGLKATFESVAMQTCREFEHIIIDGGSTDNSVDVIKEYVVKVESQEPRVESVIWVSEKDRGIYDGMNKGVEIASGIRVVNALNRSEFLEDKHSEADQPEGTGVENKVVSDYLYFLNSGDTLAAENSIQEMVDAIDGSDFVIGRVNKTYQGRMVGQTDLLKEEDLSLYQMFLHGINHQAALIKRPLLVTTPYDVNIHVSADWKFFVQKIVLESASVKFMDITFANFDITGVSANAEALRKERMQIFNTFVPKRIARDYLAIAPHYYEVTRVEWLLRHPFWYKVYRGMTTLGRKIMRE